MRRLALGLPVRMAILVVLLGLYVLQPAAGWIGMVGVFVYGIVLPRLTGAAS
jgi:hypothetical protein